MHLPQLGKSPAGRRLASIRQSPHYRDGQFHNIHPTPLIAEGYSLSGEVYKAFFKKNPRKRPANVIPSVKTDLRALSPESNVLVWFGHSSYFMQIDGLRFLVDPVFSGSASPVPGGTKAFKGSDAYTAADMPSIDYLLITHDHYDHLDYKTVRSLKPKVKQVVCGLGVGEHLEFWGFDAGHILEKDWYETIDVGTRFRIHTAPTRHGSGRTLKRNNTLWLSFILESPTLKIYAGGDSGYDTHFAEISKKFGPFDLAVLDNGQYNEAWQFIHMLPEEVVKAAADLQAKRFFPVHSSKFVLARHEWDEPLRKVTALSAQTGQAVITPMIGQPVDLNDKSQTFPRWWEGLA